MSKRTRWLAIWNVIVTVLLVTALALATAPAQADNVHVYSAQGILDDGGDGSSATTDDPIESTTPDTLVSIVTTGLSTRGTHICLVTASAEANFAGTGIYIFGLSLDGGAPTAASERRVEMFDNSGINDDSFEEVSSTIAFAGLAGDHTFTFSARKSNAGNGTLNVSASAMTAVCLKKDV